LKAPHQEPCAWGSPVACATRHVPVSLGTRMIEQVAEGGGNAVQVILLGRCFRHARRASCGTAPGGWGRGPLAGRRALLSSLGVLRQSALPRHSPTCPEPALRTTLHSSEEPPYATSILLGAPALIDRSLQPHPPEPSREGRLHAADGASSRLAGTCSGSHGAACVRWCRLAQQHAVADGGRGEGEGQGGAEGVRHVTPPLMVPELHARREDSASKTRSCRKVSHGRQITLRSADPMV